MEPDDIPDRTYGTLVTDTNTRELAMAIRDAVFSATGHYPHVIISRLKRTKLDPNRVIVEAAQGNSVAEEAWREFHGYIDIASEDVTRHYNKGFYIDLHGHGHAIKRLELGYLLTSSDLMLSDNSLSVKSMINKSSLRDLSNTTTASFADLVRGPKSLGTLFEERGVPAVPSTNQRNPGAGSPYFSGGYNTARHGSRDGGTISGVQIEMHYTGIRNTEANRAQFSEKLVQVLNEFFKAHFGWNSIAGK